MRLPAFWSLLKGALAAWWADNLPRKGASLAYYTLFAVAPVLVVAIGIAGIAFGAESVRAEVLVQVSELIGEEAAQAVQLLLRGLGRKATGVVATVVGGITFFVTATGAFLELQTALNEIWRVRQKPGVDVKGFVLGRLLSFGLVVGVGFLLLVSLVVSAALAAAGRWLEGAMPVGAEVVGAGNLLLSLLVVTLLFAMVYKLLPDVELRWRQVWTGAAMTAILFTIGKALIGLYLGRSGFASSYGAAGSLLLLLLWVYYSAQVVLLGAEFTRLYAERFGRRTVPMAHAERTPEPEGRRR